jgi:hypothetical protein
VFSCLTFNIHSLVLKCFCFFFNFSDFRQIPDNQEVFTHAETDQSIIVEIMEYVENTDEIAIK